MCDETVLIPRPGLTRRKYAFLGFAIAAYMNRATKPDLSRLMTITLKGGPYLTHEEKIKVFRGLIPEVLVSDVLVDGESCMVTNEKRQAGDPLMCDETVLIPRPGLTREEHVALGLAIVAYMNWAAKSDLIRPMTITLKGGPYFTHEEKIKVFRGLIPKVLVSDVLVDGESCMSGGSNSNPTGADVRNVAQEERRVTPNTCAGGRFHFSRRRAAAPAYWATAPSR